MAKTAGIKPLFDYLLIKPLAAETRTPSGILLPDSVKEKPQAGEVMAIGPGAHNPDGKLIPMLIKIGQKVLYKKWGGNEVKVGTEEWLLIKQEDVMAIVE
ncbi:MAG: co-chaperone GroES [bacterium]|nr:co-chaperone GroES [bacterium]